MIYALYIEQKITIFALYTKHKYKNQINNLTMENELQVIGTKEVEERIIELRGQKILLDRDVAELYKAVRNNPEKFPSGYFFTLKPSEKQYVVENFHRMENLKKSTVEPKAFTEKGLYMLATILKSPRATQTTIAIIDSFVKLRELIRNVDAIQNEPDLIKQKGIVKRTGQLLSVLLIDDADTTEMESTIELNLMAVKLKHTVKRIKNNNKTEDKSEI